MDDLRKMQITREQDRIELHKYRIELELKDLESTPSDSSPNEESRKKREEDYEKLTNNKQID